MAEATTSPSTGRSARDERLRLELLAAHSGNLADVARAMGKARMQLHRWCKRFGIAIDGRGNALVANFDHDIFVQTQ